jgi:hypothetical protein
VLYDLLLTATCLFFSSSKLRIGILILHEAMLNANIEIFGISYEESVSYFKRLENLEKISHTNGPNPFSLPVENKKSVTNRLGKSS